MYYYDVNFNNSSSFIRVIDSHQCSVGKSLYIRKLKDKLATELKKNGLIFGKSTKLMISVPLHGPVVTSDEVLNMFFDAEVKSCIIHIDIPQTVILIYTSLFY